MKNIYRKLSIIFLICLFCLKNLYAQIPFSGTRTVGSGGYYSTLTLAVSDAITNGINGAVVFELLSSYSSTSETFPISVPLIAGVSPTNTITIRPQASAYGVSIVSSNSTATIDLNGAKYIIIDGRLGGIGSKNLSIGNSSTTGVAIRLINDACFNKIIYDTVWGVNSASAGGVIFFSTTTGTRGNDSNTVDNCDIKDGATTPATSIYSLGTSTTSVQYNSNNFITNNNIYNFWLATAETNAFKIAGGNTDWVMSGNSIFQTATRTATAAFQQYIWNCNNSSANNHMITNNYIGGSAPQCGGTAWTATSTVGFRLTGAYLNVGSTVPSTFSGNTFANINLTSGGTAYSTIPGVFSGPWLVGGLTNVMNNTFGSMNSVNSIVVNSNINNNLVVPIGATGTTAGVINIRGNNIGGINVAGTSASISSNLYAIDITTSTTTTTYNVDSNVIGNYIADNMITSAASTSTTGQQLSGFYCTATSFINFRYNTIRNFRNNTVGTSITPVNWVHAIDISGNSVDSIIGNSISNLTIGSAFQNNTSGSASLVGMRLVPATANNFVSGNQFYGFTQSNSGAASVSVIGIVTNNFLSTTILQKNIFHSFNLMSTSTTSYLVGIYAGGGTAKYINNVIRFGIDSTGSSITTNPVIYGIYKTSGSNNFLFNSVYIGGTGVGTGAANTYAFISSATAVDSIMNNIFSNERSNASTGGIHYAISLAGNTTLTSNGNVFWTNGTGGTLGNYISTTCNTLSSWSAASGTDGASAFANPQFVNPTGGNGTINLHISAFTPTPVEASGVPIPYITDDIDGQLRSTLTPTDIGADAGNFIIYDLIPPAIVNPALGNTALTTDRTFLVNITDGTGVPISGVYKPRVYFKKYSYGSWNSNPGVFVSGNAKNGSWSFTISSAIMSGLSIADSVYYFIVAQDSSSNTNLGSLPAGVSAVNTLTVTSPPTILLNYIIVTGMSGTITVGSGGTYPSLTTAGGAFAAINAASLTGNVTLSIISDITEDATNMLNQWNESGAGNYTVTISPNAPTLRSIAGSAAASSALITLNGADRVKIDGRFGGSGMYLSIRNRNTGGATIQLTNDAHRDTIQYCYLEGLSNTSPGATVWISAPASTGTGNDSNAIIYNYIKDTLNNPLGGSVQNTAFYSNGNYNSENSFSYNQIFNYLYQGVNIGTGLLNHDNWVCTGNSFYQGANAAAKTSSSASQAFYLNSGNNWTISNNNIGGSAADRSGTAWKSTYTTSATMVMQPIYVNVGTTTATNITGNNISNICSNPTGVTGSAIAGVYVIAGLVNINNNIIGGGTNPYDTILEGSYNGGGIVITGGTTVNIGNNNIGNIYNYLNYGSATKTLGINVSGGTAVNITNNTIHDIRGSNPGYGTAPAYTGSSPAGIYVSASSASLLNIEGNNISNIQNLVSTATASTADGITISGGTCNVQRNRIFNIYGNSIGTGTTVSYCRGLLVTTSGHTFRNNQISMGNNATGESLVWGVLDNNASGTNTYYYNSIFVNGRTASGTNNSYCIQRTSTVNDIVWNNILYNKRTTAGTGYNYATGTSNATGISTASIDYNLMIVSDTSKIAEMPIGVPNGIASFNTLFSPVTYNTNWMEVASNLPVQNLFTDTSVGNLGIVTTNAVCWYANGKGIALAGVTGDYNNNTTTRSTTISTGSTDIGSVEFTTATTPPIAIASSSPALFTTTTYSFANRPVASIVWGSTGIPPFTCSVKYYSGTNAPSLVGSKTQYNCYVNIAATGATGLNYTISIMSDSAIFGNVSGSGASRIAFYSGSAWSLVNTSSSNTSTGMLGTSGTLASGTLSSNFTGTDISNPLPVEWLSVTAVPSGNDVNLSWTISNEMNNMGFDVERSTDGKKFTSVAFVENKGNSNGIVNYVHYDLNAFIDENQTELFYKIRQTDLDNQISFSKIVRVTKLSTNPNSITVSPNPFSDQVSISFISDSENSGLLEIMNIEGKLVYSLNRTIINGLNNIVIKLEDELTPGVYFIRYTDSSKTITRKLIKI